MSHIAAVIAYPVCPLTAIKMDEEDFSTHIENSKLADDSMDMGGNFFAQLDSMMAAVKVESSALDSMKEKLKEVDSLRNQVSAFTKRLLDADQANLNLKTNLMNIQEAHNTLKKSKEEVESAMVPLRQELNRTKEAYSKERMARLSAQQETAMLKDQIMRLEKINENVDRECKTIPALVESNEILKTELATLRKRYKEDKTAAANRIKYMETQARDVEGIKAEVRTMAMRLLEVSSTTTAVVQGGPSQSRNMGRNVESFSNGHSDYQSNSYSSNMNHMNMQQQQNMHYNSNSSSNNSHNGGVGGGGGNVQYEYGFDGAEEDDDVYGDGVEVDDEEADSDVTNGSHVHGVAGGHSQQHTVQYRQTPQQLQHQHQHQHVRMASNGKKKMKRIVAQNQSQGPQQGQGHQGRVRVMQQLAGPSSSQVIGEYSRSSSSSGGVDGNGNGNSNFSLPRLN